MSPVEFKTPTATLKGWQTGRDPKLVALHGWLDNANTWQVLAPHLPPMIALDVRGHGHSSWAHAPYHFWDSLADLAAVIEALERPVHLLGHSMGAGIVSLFAGCFPEKVLSLALVEGYGPWLEPKLDARAQLRRAAEHAQVAFKPRRPFTSVQAACDVRVKHGVSPVDAHAIFPVVERNVSKTQDGWVWRYDPWLTRPSPLRMGEDEVNTVMQAIRCPVSLVLADDGMLTDSAMLQARLAWGGVDCLNLPGNHHLHLYPENASIISEFWRPLWT